MRLGRGCGLVLGIAMVPSEAVTCLIYSTLRIKSRDDFWLLTQGRRSLHSLDDIHGQHYLPVYTLDHS